MANGKYDDAKRSVWQPVLCAVVLVGGNGCLPNDDSDTLVDGECSEVSASRLDCSVEGYVEGEVLDVGLVAYGCTGNARPDLDAHYAEGVPSGLLCADEGELDDGRQGYCCTPERTVCAYDPVSDCSDDTSGFECWGANRPESLNPALNCSNGYQEGELKNYCCTGQEPAPACEEREGICSIRLMGFACPGGAVPRGENLGANRSRADYFHPACSIPMDTPNPEWKPYCCFMPAPHPLGGTCVPHRSASRCDPGQFAFACYGTDRPEENNLPMICDDGARGTSEEGYDANVYCCDFDE